MANCRFTILILFVTGINQLSIGQVTKEGLRLSKRSDFLPITSQKKLDSFFYYHGKNDPDFTSLTIVCSDSFNSIEFRKEHFKSIPNVSNLTFTGFNPKNNIISGLEIVPTKSSGLRLAFQAHDSKFTNIDFTYPGKFPALSHLDVLGYRRIKLPKNTKVRSLTLSGNFIDTSTFIGLVTNHLFIHYPNSHLYFPNNPYDTLDWTKSVSKIRTFNPVNSRRPLSQFYRYQLPDRDYEYGHGVPKSFTNGKILRLTISHSLSTNHTNNSYTVDSTFQSNYIKESKRISSQCLSETSYSYCDFFILDDDYELTFRYNFKKNRAPRKQRIIINRFYYPDLFDLDDLCSLSINKKRKLSFYFDKHSKNFDASLFKCLSESNSKIQIYIHKEGMDPQKIADFKENLKENSKNITVHFSKYRYIFNALFL
jgi:hypothetical protein